MKAIMGFNAFALAVLWVWTFPQSGAKPNQAQVAGMDKTFATKAAMGSMAEVQLGKLAQEKGAKDFTREFGAMMAKEHGMALDELKGIVSKKNISLPTALDAAHQADYNKLANLSGASFDQAYRAAMIQDHEKDLREFKSQAAKGKDAELRAFAQKGVPMIQKHLNIIRAGKM